ncbi:MAG: AAA family ATPase [Bacilli bacterium]|nr:AAA family ATPase [Bacilli bacterium]
MEKIYLKDIAGYDEEKQEAEKIIEVLKNHKKYEKIGAYIPKGLILSGRPGVGKTMLAKAIANESNVPFYEFESNECETETATIKSIKDVFKKARENAPSIIFIDELDELVMTEEFYSDYSRKTLKILLTEIDGISSTSGIMVIATTNARGKLPPALIRSGRMDKRITMPMPDLKSREAIFKLYLVKNDITKSIDPKVLANKSSGFSGADIKTLVNETIIDCASKKKTKITLADFERIIPVVFFQEIRKVDLNGPEDITCYHEIGHFILNYVLNKTIGALSVERYGNVKGFMRTDDFPTRRVEVTKNTLDHKVMIELAGMAAEETYIKDLGLGGMTDLSNAKALIISVMNIGAFGFDLISEKINSIEFMMNSSRNNADSEIKSAKIEKFMADKLQTLYEEDKKILLKNKKLAEYIFKELKSKVKLNQTEMEELIKKYNKGEQL